MHGVRACCNIMIKELTDGLEKRYGEISLKHGPVINYLGMVLDFTQAGEVKVTMAGYTDDVLKSSGIPSTARNLVRTDCSRSETRPSQCQRQ